MCARVALVVAVVLSQGAHAFTCDAFATPLTDHSCFHATHGPYASVTATPGETPQASTMSVDPVHTEFTVQLPSSPAVVTYQPLRSGLWVVFQAPGVVPVRLVDPATQQALPVLFSTTQTGCAAFALAQVFEFTALVRYTVRLEGAATQRLVIEKLDDFLLSWAPDADHDGFGSRADAVRTACVAPAGFIEDARDCDDTRADISPAAQEVCNGLDDDCDRRVDEGLGVGAVCSVGVGACRGEGLSVCTLSGEVRCSAEPGVPSSEHCNGVDDDCDGTVDEGGDALCGSAEGPRCRTRGAVTACGCSVDADCGPSGSGRICDDLRGVCVDGCYRNDGRNGCASPLLCSSLDPRQPGACIATCAVDAHCAEVARPACSGRVGPFAGCVACTTDAHCPSGVCQNERCVECTGDDVRHCRASGTGGACLSSSTCGCRSHDDCSVEQFCDFERQRCAPCPDWVASSEAIEQARIERAAQLAPVRSCSTGLGLNLLLLVAWVLPRRGRGLLVAALALAVLTGCREKGLVQACVCTDAEVCVAGACRQPCETTDDCPSGTGCHPTLRVCLEVERNRCRSLDGGCSLGLGPLAVKHACQHAGLGPYLDVSAAAVGAPAPPSMNVPQVVYRVSVTDEEGDLSYVPTRDGAHVLFISAGQLAVFDGETALTPEVVEALGGRCASLSRGASFVLRSGQPYRLRLRGSRAVGVFIEHLGSFARPYAEVCAMDDGGVKVE